MPARTVYSALLYTLIIVPIYEDRWVRSEEVYNYSSFSSFAVRVDRDQDVEYWIQPLSGSF